MLVGVGGKDTESVVEALSDQIRRLPKTMIDTLTWDRGLLHWHRPLRSPVEPTAAFLGFPFPHAGPSPLTRGASTLLVPRR